VTVGLQAEITEKTEKGGKKTEEKVRASSSKFKAGR